MSTAVEQAGRKRLAVRVEGTVQGVGFRPYVYRLARSLDLGGFVLNDELGVLVEIEGHAGPLDEFLRRLPEEAPPLARVESVLATAARARGELDFTIAPSRGERTPATQISPDSATCEDCLAELADPADRRYRYPFINCTNCGPRFTIVTAIPYDRPHTTMAGFRMCAACQAEYEDPADRRFHAQPNACPDCGPAAELLDAGGRPLDRAGHPDAVAAAAARLRAGAIVAVKGLGGFHLACRADDEDAVAELRRRKHREERPFAVMCADADAASRLARLSVHERRLLEGPERPIVIARRLPDAPVAESVAPGNPDLGVMLPYTPLHHLLLADAGAALVMTSGNASDEPIAFTDEDALRRLAPIADCFCTHDRPIHTRTDDSVLRALDPAVGPGPLLVRRSRGWVPRSVTLPEPASVPVLACGAELKNTFCLAQGDRAWVSHHIGDLKNYETLTSYRSGIGHLQRLLEIEPRLVAHDLHPDYLSSAHAAQLEDVELLAVQHHHAHLAAVAAEHGVRGPVAGAIYDGTGLGPDGTVWGGELLVGDADGYERAGFVFPVRLPGGDAAVRQPWRMACAWLAALHGGSAPARPPEPLASLVDWGDWEAVAGICDTGLASPLTTSAGRLFDAVAALCGLRGEVAYEGQAAIELEARAAAAPATGAGAYPMPITDGHPGPLLIDARATLEAVLADLDDRVSVELIAARFHAAFAAATVAALARLAARHELRSVALGGGVFQNRILLEAVVAGLRERGLEALLPRELPINDGGISYGQAAIAAAHLRRSGGAA